jgi:hypothetical protein
MKWGFTCTEDGDLHAQKMGIYTHRRWGFTCTEDGDLHAQKMGIYMHRRWIATIFCNFNQSVKPAFLQRHLNSKHKDLASKPTDILLEKKRDVTKRQTRFQKSLTVYCKCLKASYAVSLLVAKHKEPHNITEELIIPCAVEITSIMSDELCL